MVNSNTVYSIFINIIENFRKGEVFEVNYTNLNDVSTNDGSRVDNQSILLLLEKNEPINYATSIKNNQLWVEYNHKKFQRIRLLRHIL